MKINPIIPINISKKISFALKNEYKIDSFVKSNKDNNADSSIVQQAVNITDEVYDMILKGECGFSEIIKPAKRLVPNISLREINRLHNAAESFTERNCVAYTKPQYSDFNLKKIAIYMEKINPKDSYSAKIEKLASFAHEYTHCLQRYNDDSYMGLKNISNGIITTARVLNNTSADIFSQIEGHIKNSFVINGIKFLRTKTDISPENALYLSFATFLGNFDENGFEKYTNNIFEKGFTTYYDSIKGYLPVLLTESEVKNIIKHQCMLRAQMEKEAYTAQNKVYEKYDKENLSAEAEYSPLIYEKIAEALS